MGKIDIKKLEKRQALSPTSGPEQIGFDPKTQKWYGWSHRGIYGFGIGHTVKKGDCTLSSGWVEGCAGYKKDMKKIAKYPAGFKCKTLTDCKNLAKLYAASIS